MNAVAFILTILLALATPTFAHASGELTNQGGNQGPCDVTNMPANQWTLVEYDNAGQPCLANDMPQSECDHTSYWTYLIRGYLDYAPTKRNGAKAIEQRTYVAGGSEEGNAVNGQIVWTSVDAATAYNYLLDDVTVPTNAYETQVALHAAEWVLAPSIPDSPDSGAFANYQSFLVFAKPIGGSATCVGTYYDTEEHLIVWPLP